MISSASRHRVGVWSWALAWISFCHGCAVEATVYRSAPGEAEYAADAAVESGTSTHAVNDTSVYGCAAQERGGDAILADIVERLRQDLLVADSTCATDADCGHTFITPACNQATAMCETCPDPLQQTLFGVHLGLCLGPAAERCCRDPAAAPDCIVRACATRCGDQ